MGLLLITAVIWGGGFVAQRMAMDQMGPFLFNGYRFFLGAITLLPLMLVRKRQHTADDLPWKKTILIGISAGFLLFFGATFQQLGLVYTTAGKAGFITGLYVIIVPLLGMLWGDQAPWNTWIGAILAVLGLYFLSAIEGLRIALGDGYVLLGAFFWAGHVQLLARYAPRMDAIRLSFVQALFTSLLSLGVGFIQESFEPAVIVAAAWPIFYGGVISIGIAYTMQVIAQQSARPTPAAIILSLESVFAALWGWLFLGELFNPRGWGGSLLMLSGMVIAQFNLGRIRDRSPKA